MSESSHLLDLPQLPRRVTVAREGARLTQTALSQQLGFKDRQTLAAIESGQRQVSVEDLLTIMKVTGRDLDFFTDPFRLDGEGGFSYRAKGAEEIAVDQFEEQVGRWLALWRHLADKRGQAPEVLRPRLAINERSSFEEAQAAGEQLAVKLKLGKVPAARLVEAVEKQLKILVLFADLPNGVSGAAVQLASGDSVLIDRNERPWRRTFDLAHELFHVLTWDALPPERVDREKASGYKSKRTEQLADNFAGALLMPGEALVRRWAEKPADAKLGDWLAKTSAFYGVSVQALFWRLVALGLLKTTDLSVSKLKTIADPTEPPPRFSRRYLEQVAWGIENGQISVRRTLDLLGISLATLRELCRSHEVELSVGL